MGRMVWGGWRWWGGVEGWGMGSEMKMVKRVAGEEREQTMLWVDRVMWGWWRM